MNNVDPSSALLKFGPPCTLRVERSKAPPGTSTSGRMSSLLRWFPGFDRPEERKKYARRVLEIVAISKWADGRYNGTAAYDKDIVLIGDMNVPAMAQTNPGTRSSSRRAIPKAFFDPGGRLLSSHQSIQFSNSSAIATDWSSPNTHRSSTNAVIGDDSSTRSSITVLPDSGWMKYPRS